MLKYDETLIGKNIKRIRIEKGLTQQQISEATGIQNTVISAYENNKKTPGLYTLVSIAKALNVTLDELTFGDAASKIVNSSNDDPEIIIRCIYELWKRGMIVPPINLQQSSSVFGGIQKTDFWGVWQFSHPLVADRLLNQLNDHARNVQTYSQPEKHIEQILESSMCELKNDLLQ